MSLTEHAVVLGAAASCASCSRDLLQDQATLDRLIGLRLDDAVALSKPGGIPRAEPLGAKPLRIESRFHSIRKVGELFRMAF